MNAKQKKIVKIVGISVGALLLIGGIVALVIYKKRQNELSDQPTFKGSSDSNSTGNSTGNSYTPPTQVHYTPKEIERMQTWLVQIATIKGNTVILDAIRSTGGIDGKIGNGFHTALNEAIKKGYVKSLADLYSKTN